MAPMLNWVILLSAPVGVHVGLVADRRTVDGPDILRAGFPATRDSHSDVENQPSDKGDREDDHDKLGLLAHGAQHALTPRVVLVPGREVGKSGSLEVGG